MSEITNAQELDILRRYAEGENLKVISAAVGLPLEDDAPNELVVGVVSQLAGFSRPRAQELVKRAAAKMAERSAGPPRDIEVRVEPRADFSRTPGEAVLARAAAAGGKYARRAEKIREQITELDGELAEYQRVIDAERRVEELRAELAKATEELRSVRRPGPTRAAERGNRAASAREVRAWALANGVECNRMGIIPVHVLDAYYGAHPQVAA